MSIAAYQTTMREMEDPRKMERRVIVEVTEQLRQAANATRRTPEFHEAVYRNRQLWMALVRDLADPGNAYPAELKGSLISLGLWVQRESAEVANGNADLKDLIGINECIIAGLAGGPATEPQDAAAAT